MKKPLLLLAALPILLFSCQKDYTLDLPSVNPGTNTGNFIGNWRFLDITAATLVTNETSDGMVTFKTVTTSNYTSTNNTGTVAITNQNMSYTNLGYAINTIARGLIYEDGKLVDSIKLPLNVVIPPTTAQSSFTRIGADSLSFPAGGGLGGTQTTGPSGIRFRVEQDKLYFTQRVNESGSRIEQGVRVKENKQAEVVTRFQRM